MRQRLIQRSLLLLRPPPLRCWLLACLLSTQICLGQEPTGNPEDGDRPKKDEDSKSSGTLEDGKNVIEQMTSILDPEESKAPEISAPEPAVSSVQAPTLDAGADAPPAPPDVNLDLESEMISWNGRHWNITNNRIFRGRFEKYLNSPEDSSEDSLQYNALIKQIMDLLAPNRLNPTLVDQAFALLPKASEHSSDANLCDSIANQVYSVWLAHRQNDRLTAANQSLEEERRRVEWNLNFVASGSRSSPPAQQTGLAATEWAKREAIRLKTSTQPLARRLGEINAILKGNEVKREISVLQAKIEFQALILQLFLQRRFEHVLIATRFYRNVFADGEQQIKLGDSAKDFFGRTTGLPPTVNTVDAIANQAIHDTEEGVAAFRFLLDKGELDSATNRLSETFIIGEYTPSIRTLEREKKRQVLEYYQKSQELINALDVRDYTTAQELLDYLQTAASDFDPSRPSSAIRTAQTITSMHLAKARNAAVSGDKETFEKELKQAAEIWPTNPQLMEVAGQIFTQTDQQQRTLVDFDQLVSQKNFRLIYDDQLRFIAATINDEDRRTRLASILGDMGTVNGTILKAEEFERRGDYAGAWEIIELSFLKFPDDAKLNRLKAELTTRATRFVSALRQAEDHEQRSQLGSSLAWYLKAQQEYPPSELARDGISRLTDEIMGESASNLAPSRSRTN